MLAMPETAHDGCELLMSSPTYRLRALARRASTDYCRLHNLACDIYKESAADPEIGNMVADAQRLLGSVAARLVARANIVRDPRGAPSG